MYTTEEIEKEVSEIFVDLPVRVHVEHLPNEDALYILIIGKTQLGRGFPSVSNKISGLDMLSAINPIDILRSKIYRMYDLMKRSIDKEE